MWSPVGTPIPTLNDWKQSELPGLCRTCWTRKSPALPSLGKLLSQLPESHPIWEQYEILSPILSDSGREPALSNNFEEQYVSTLFVKSSTQSQFQARLLAAFYLPNMEPPPEQKNALERSGLGDLLKNAEPMKSIGIDSQYIAFWYCCFFQVSSNL